MTGKHTPVLLLTYTRGERSAYEKRRRVENRKKKLGLREKNSPARNPDITVKWEK
jgi:hypothetical protein